MPFVYVSWERSDRVHRVQCQGRFDPEELYVTDCGRSTDGSQRRRRPKDFFREGCRSCASKR